MVQGLHLQARKPGQRPLSPLPKTGSDCRLISPLTPLLRYVKDFLYNLSCSGATVDMISTDINTARRRYIAGYLDHCVALAKLGF